MVRTSPPIVTQPRMRLDARSAALLASLITPCGSPSAQQPRLGADAIANAVRADRPPVIGGRDDDPVWRAAPAMSDFSEFLSTQGKTPRYKTELKVAYED